MKVRSILYDEASGSIGALTAANSQGGTYFKQKPDPTNPNTIQQQVVRNGLRAANVAWETATEAVRTAWKTFGATCTRTNQTGATVTLNGWNAFSRVYVVLNQIGQATAGLITSAPAGQGFLANATISLSQGANDILTVTNNSQVTENIAVYVGAATRPTINNYGGSFNFNVTGAVAAAGTLATTVTMTSGRYWVRVQTYTADGQLSLGSTSYIDYVAPEPVEGKRK